MKHFTKWADGRNPYLAIFSHTLASSAGLAFALLKNIREDTINTQDFRQAPLNEWLKLYRRHRAVRLSLFDIFPDPTGFFGHGDEFFSSVNRYQDGIPLEEAEKEFDKIFNKEGHQDIISKYTASMIPPQEESDDNPPEDEILEGITKYEFYFFLRVYTPCWLLYGQLPGQLLRNARQGDIESLEQLIRLDSSIIFDSRISKRIHDDRTKDKKFFNTFTSSIQKPPKKKITPQKVKILFAAQISDMSASLGEKLTEPEIRALFDAIARDKGEGDIDTDIPESPEAFAKAIQREVPFWAEAHK